MPSARLPGVLAAGLLLPALLAAGWGLAALVPPPQWWPALLWPDPGRMAEVVAADSLLPRLAASLLCGAALGLAGALAQLGLRNPLAAPDTLGISAGAYLALTAASLFAPGLLVAFGRDAVAFAGGGAGVALVVALTWRGGLAPVAVALAGLAVGLYAGSLGVVLSLLHSRVLSGLFVWNAGSLVQLGWDVPAGLAWRLAAGCGAVMLLRRPLRLMELPDQVAAGLGVPVPLLRLAALALSVALAASVVGMVGVIGFVGLAAPALARLAGAAGRTLLWSPVLGAGLLAATDQLLQRVSGLLANLLPTGAVTALLGLPLLLWLLTRMAPGLPAAQPGAVAHARFPARRLLLAGAVLVAAAGLAALFGRGLDGWGWTAALLPQRLPRIAAAAVAGVLLAAAGTVLQRMLGNPMASPDVLGLGTGAAVGLVATTWFGGAGLAVRLGAGTAGAALVLAVLLFFARGGAPGRVLLAGVGVFAAFQSAVALLLASGDPRAEAALAALSGSTYGAGPGAAAVAAGLAVLLLGGAAMALRWLDILPLGGAVATALGVRTGLANALLLVLVAGMTAVATLLAGPLSFVGLMAPHIARSLGLTRAGGQLAMAGLAGAVVMVVADWLGRTLLFPAEIPAGLMASLVGGPVLLRALARWTA